MLDPVFYTRKLVCSMNWVAIGTEKNLCACFNSQGRESFAGFYMSRYVSVIHMRFRLDEFIDFEDEVLLTPWLSDAAPSQLTQQPRSRQFVALKN